jgi:uncharacterized protein YdeI (YjbR/CyaY-like superfamily)
MEGLQEEDLELVMPDAAEWRRWLVAHHADTPAVRLMLSRRGSSSVTQLTHATALEEALAFGWIDGQARRRDASSWMIRFTPRRARSPWSKRNTEIAERLIAEGRMHPAGAAEIERAKADGRWDAAYAGPATIEVPEDFEAALDASAVAKDNFGRLTAQNRYAILYRLGSAKREETRARRIAEFVKMLEEGRTVYPQRAQLRR